MSSLEQGAATTWVRRSRRATALVAVVFVTSLGVVALSGVPALAEDPDPTTTTELPPDPTTTTEVPPEPTTTTIPADTTTTVPTDTTTTEPVPNSTTTTEPEAEANLTFLNDLASLAGTLDPGEALVPRPEFGALSGHQRALVEQLQISTDLFALRRFALLDLADEVATAKDALKDAREREYEAVMREIIGLAEPIRSEDGDTSGAATLSDAADGDQAAQAADDRVAAFRALRRRLAGDRKDARAERVEAQSALAAANARLALLTQAVDEALADRRAAESAIEDELGSGAVRARPDGISATLDAAQDGQGEPIGTSDLELPVPGGTLSSPFGLRNDPLSGGAGFHPGIDFADSSGTPIHAAGAGVVVIAGDCGGYGYCVVIDHGSSLATLYGHESQMAVSVGQHVDAGEVIGYVGSTGMSTGPHLHFEVRLRGLPIDPVLALLPT